MTVHVYYLIDFNLFCDIILYSVEWDNASIFYLKIDNYVVIDSQSADDTLFTLWLA